MKLFARKLPYLEARRIAIEEIKRRGWEHYFLPNDCVGETHIPADTDQRAMYGHVDPYISLYDAGIWHYCFTGEFSKPLYYPEIVVHRRTGKVLRAKLPPRVPF